MKIRHWRLIAAVCVVASWTSGCATEQQGTTVATIATKKSKAKDAVGPSVAGWSKQTTCGGSISWQEIANFRGAKPISSSAMRIAQRHTVRLKLKTREQMIAKIVEMFPGSKPNDVELGEHAINAGKGVCTGTLLNQRTVITAAHCFQPNLVTPSVWKDGQQIALNADMLALLFEAESNYQFVPATRRLGEHESKRVTKLEEYGYRKSSSDLDYAIIKVQPFYGLGRTMPINLKTLTDNAPIAIIHHPHGFPKKISIGNASAQSDVQLNYTDADTAVGTSGAGILDERGHLVGVHTDGQCANQAFGYNFGVSIRGISGVSPTIKPSNATQ